MGTIV